MTVNTSVEVASTLPPPPGEGAVVLPAGWPSGMAEGKSPSVKSAPEREDRERFRQLIDTRRHIGYGMALTAFALLITLGVYSFSHFREFAGPEYSQLPVRVFWLLVGGHVAVTVAFVFLGYQLLRAAERLVLPYWWAESNPELTRLMLGATDPLTAVGQTTERVMAVVEKAADPIFSMAQRLANNASRNKES